MKLVAWFGNHCDNREDHQLWLFTGGEVLRGVGHMQYEAETPEQTTVGALRDQWDDDSICKGLSAGTPAWSYGDDGTLEFIVVEVYLA